MTRARAGLWLGAAAGASILLAPFTCLRDVPALRVGRPLNLLVRDRFDNSAILRSLAARLPRRQVTILHSTADRVLAFRMGKRLAAAYPEWVRFMPVEGADHDTLPDPALPLVRRLTRDL